MFLWISIRFYLETFLMRNVFVFRDIQDIGKIQKIINGKKEKYKRLVLITSKFGYDLSQIIQFIQDPIKLKKYFNDKMYNKNKKGSLMIYVDKNFDINKDILPKYPY